MRPVRLLPLCGIPLLAACAALPPPEGPRSEAPVAAVPASRATERDTLRLINEVGRLLAQQADQQMSAYEAARSAFDRQPDALQRLRLALFKAMPQAPWQNDTQALQLLRTLGDAPAPLRDLAALLTVHVEERQQRQRDSERRAEEAQQKLQALLAERQRQLRDEQRKVEDLEQKVEALRKIDRDTLRRATRR